MKFHLSDEQIALQDSVEKVIKRVLPPEQRRALMDAGDDDDRASWLALMEMGLSGILVPAEAGGLGLGLTEAALALEIVGRCAVPGPFLTHLLAGWAIAQSPDKELKAQLVPRIVDGRCLATVCVSGVKLESAPTGLTNGTFSGDFAWCPGGERAEVFVLVLQTGLALVEGAERVTAEPREGMDRTRRLATLRFDKAEATMIATPDQAQRLIDAALVLAAADALGGAEQCMTMSVDYAKQREQFGSVIGRFQAVKHQLANLALEVEPSRALVWYAAYAWDSMLVDSSRISALAKAHMADRFMSVARAAVQAHGGIGYTWDYDLHIWFRRALYDHAWLATPSELRERAATLADW